MKPFLARARRGDRAFARLYRRHVGDVYRYALLLLRNPEDAERVTQTTFLNAYRAFGRGERPANARAWLLALVHNVCRRRVRAPTADLDEDDAVRAVPDPTAPTPAEIRRAVDRLPFDRRAALVMRELEGRSYAEIAQVLQLPAAAVETLVFEARRSLREQLEGALSCHQAERAISLRVDGRLPRSERRHLRAHLRECRECAGFAQSQRAQRSAWKTLAAVPLPASLQSFFGPGGVLTSARGAAGGVGLLVEALVIVAIAAVAVGLGHESNRRETPNESARAPSPLVAQAAAARPARPAGRSITVVRTRTVAKPERSQAAPVLAVSSVETTPPSSTRSRHVRRTRPTAFTVRARANPKPPGHKQIAGGSSEREPGPKQTAPTEAPPTPPVAAPAPAPPPVVPLELPAFAPVPPVPLPALPNSQALREHGERVGSLLDGHLQQAQRRPGLDGLAGR